MRFLSGWKHQTEAFSLIEVLVAIGLSSIVAMSTASLMTQLGHNLSSVSSKAQFNSLVSTIQGYLNNSVTCPNLFQGYTFSPLPTAGTPTTTPSTALTPFPAPASTLPVLIQYRSPPTPPMDLSNTFQTLGVQPNTSLNINRFLLTTLVYESANNYLANLVLEAQNYQSGNLTGPVFQITFNVQLSYTSGSITSCAGASNYWADYNGSISSGSDPVAIGTTTPTTNVMLDVSGNIFAHSGNGQSGSITASGTVSGAALTTTGAVSTGTIQTTGSVGVGISSPVSTVHVIGTGGSVGNNAASNNQLMIATGTTANSDLSIYMGADKANGIGYIQASAVGGNYTRDLHLNYHGANVLIHGWQGFPAEAGSYPLNVGFSNSGGIMYSTYVHGLTTFAGNVQIDIGNSYKGAGYVTTGIGSDGNGSSVLTFGSAFAAGIASNQSGTGTNQGGIDFYTTQSNLTTPTITFSNTGNITTGGNITTSSGNITTSTGNIVASAGSVCAAANGAFGSPAADPNYTLWSSSTGQLTGNEWNKHQLVISTGLTTGAMTMLIGVDQSTSLAYLSTLTWNAGYAQGIILNPRGGWAGISANSWAQSAPSGTNFVVTGGIYATGNICGPNTSGCSTSDARIKEDIQLQKNNLAMIQRLQLKNYQFRDHPQLEKDFSQRKIGFIAQEVEEVYPEAVQKQSYFIPNLLTFAKKVSFQEKEKTLTIQLKIPHELKIKDRVKLVDKTPEPEEIKFCTVSHIASPTEFTAHDCFDHSPSQLFVYGKEIHDFRFLDYNQIFSMGIGAIQELKKEKDAEIEDLKETIQTLQNKLTTLEQKLHN